MNAMSDTSARNDMNVFRLMALTDSLIRNS